MPTADASGSPPPTASGGGRQRRGRRAEAAAAVDSAGSGQGRGRRPAAGEVPGSAGGRQVRGRRPGAGVVAGSAGGRQGRGGRPEAGWLAGRAVGCRQQGCRPAVGRWLAAGAAPAVGATASGTANSWGGGVSCRSARVATAATEGGGETASSPPPARQKQSFASCLRCSDTISREPAFFCEGSKIFPHEQSTMDSIIFSTVGPYRPLPSQLHVHVHTSLINPSELVVVSHDMAAWSTPIVCRSNLELSHLVGHSLRGNVDSLARRPPTRRSPLQPVPSARLDIERCLQTRSVHMTTSPST